MSITANSKPLKNMLHNNNMVKKWIHNSTLVWQRVQASSGSVSVSYPTFSANQIVGNSSTYWDGSRSSFSGGCLQWLGSYYSVYFKALVDCKVTLSGTLQASALDGPMTYKFLGYLNGALDYSIAYKYISSVGDSSSHSVSRTINLKAGQYYAIYAQNLTDAGRNKARLGVSGSIKVSASPT